jgi:hypothetical protein
MHQSYQLTHKAHAHIHTDVLELWIHKADTIHTRHTHTHIPCIHTHMHTFLASTHTCTHSLHPHTRARIPCTHLYAELGHLQGQRRDGQLLCGARGPLDAVQGPLRGGGLRLVAHEHDGMRLWCRAGVTYTSDTRVAALFEMTPFGKLEYYCRFTITSEIK